MKTAKINSLDITKFILSIFVIALHTLYLIPNEFANIRIISTILHVAVPFFFITSGYLLFRKIELPLNQDGKKRIIKYLKHIFLLYFVWTVIYLPITIYGAYIDGSGSSFVIYSIRKFLFVGESYYSWNLWYLHGLLLAVTITFLCLKLKINTKKIVYLGIIIFIAGIGLDFLLEMDKDLLPVMAKKFINIYLWLFERVRNGIFKGFPYVAIGLYLSQLKKLQLTNGMVLFLIGFIIYYFKFEIGLIPLATGLFILICNINIKDNKYIPYFRFTSLYIYLLHMIFIFIYIVLIKQNSFYNPFFLFLFTTLNSLFFASILYYISKKKKCIFYLKNK